MKRYPNQASDFGRIRSTLETINSMNHAGMNVADDETLGYECARRQVYKFRSFDYENSSTADLEARIDLELAKKADSQGAQTFARDLRRTLHDLGWLGSHNALTPAGKALLASARGSNEEIALLREALIDLEVGDKTGTYFSHPIRVLMHLLASAPTKSRAGLELALEAKDDSPAELQRVLELYSTYRTLNSEERAQRLGESKNNIENAVKIFPSLANTAGFISVSKQRDYNITPLGLSAIQLSINNPNVQGTSSRSAGGAVPATTQTPTVPSNPKPGASGPSPATQSRGQGKRNVTVGQKKSSSTVGQHGVNRNLPGAPLTADQQNEARRKLNERTVEHQALVRFFAEQIGDARGDIYEDQTSYDLLWQNDSDKVCHLFEMKTISSDSDAQVQRAVGQLHYYAFFNVAAAFPGASITKTLIVNAQVHNDLADYLTDQNIGLVYADAGNSLTGLNAQGQDLLDLLQ